MIFCGFFLSHSAERFRVGALLCIRKIILKRGISQIFVENFSYHNAKNLQTGVLQCFRKLRVSKKFMHKRDIL